MRISHMFPPKKITTTVFVIFFSALQCTLCYSSDDVSLISSLSPCMTNASSSWVSVDLTENKYAAANVSSNNSYCTIDNSFLALVDDVHAVYEMPALLVWEHTPYFVATTSTSVIFKVRYNDAYNNAPSANYPALTYTDTNGTTYTTQLDYVKKLDATSWLYQQSVALSTGTYTYQYRAKNDVCPNEYALAQSSFMVTDAPCNFTNTSLADGSVVTNASVVVSWTAEDPDGTIQTYNLYFGASQPTMTCIYSGANTSFELSALEYGKTYYWQVEAIDNLGVSAQSPVYRFTTLGKISKPFNYPNPFNPMSQQTNIVCDVPSAQTVTIDIFSEYGTRVYHSERDAQQGINEFSYNGTDDHGNILYNGSYIARITTQEGTGICYIAITK